MAPPVIFIFGLGYVGRRFGHMMAASGWSVRGTTRQPDNFAAERAAGVSGHLHGVGSDESVTPSGEADPSLVYLRRAQASLNGRKKRSRLDTELERELRRALLQR